MNLLKSILFLGLFVFIGAFKPMHELKLSTSEIKFENNKLQIKIKLFGDDLGAALALKMKRTMVFEGKEVNKTILPYLIQYVQENFKFNINGVNTSYKFLKTSIEEDQIAATNIVWVYCEVPHFSNKSLKSINLKNTLLFNVCPEQKNITALKLIQDGDTKTLLFENMNEDNYKEIKY